MLKAGQDAISAVSNPNYAGDAKVAAEMHQSWAFMLTVVDDIIKGSPELTKILNSATLEEQPT